MKRSDLDRLEAVLLVKKEVALARLSPIVEREQAIEKLLEQLGTAHGTLHTSRVQSDMQRTGQDLVWLRWVAVRQREMQRERAMLRVRKQEELENAGRDIAQHLAIHTLNRKFRRKKSFDHPPS